MSKGSSCASAAGRWVFRCGSSYCLRSTWWFSLEAIPAGPGDVPAAGSCLRAEHRALRVRAPPASIAGRRAEMPHRGVRAALRSPKQKPACLSAHHPAHWLPSALFPAQTGNTEKGKPPSAPRRSSGDPLPLLSPTAAVAGCGRLRRAPGELLPGQCSGAGRGQSQPKSAAPQSKRETPRGTSSSLAALRAPRPARGSDLRLPRRVVRRDSSPSRARTGSPADRWH